MRTRPSSTVGSSVTSNRRRTSPPSWRNIRKTDARSSQQHGAWEQFAAPSDALNIPRRGLLYCSQLMGTEEAILQEEEFGHLDRVCLMRFPPEIAKLLRERVADGLNAQLATESATPARVPTSGDSEEAKDDVTLSGLGLTVVPTTVEDFRRFEIYVEMELGNSESARKFFAILVELPALLEGYKSLEGDLLFKAADISQMLYVYDPRDPSANDAIQKIKTSQFWEWHSGLTPATHRIRCRKFRNWRVFEKSDVAAAEKAICDAIRTTGQRQDTLAVEASTEETMEMQMLAIGISKPQDDPNVVAVIGPHNPLFKAALEGKAPNQIDKLPGTGVVEETLLRDVCSNAESFRLPMAEMIRFSFDPAGPVLDSNSLVPDNLEEIIFGELRENAEGAQIDDVFSLEELGHLNAQSEVSSAASSLGTMSRDKKRKKRKRGEPGNGQ